MTKDRPTFIKQATGGKIGKLEMDNVTVVGDADFMEMEGEIDEAVIKNTKHIIPPRLKKMAEAIKKPIANFSIPLIVTIVGGLIVAAITVFYFQPLQERTQEQSQEQKPKISSQKG
jgi:hypothetical protein